MANVHIALVGGQTYPVYLGIAETSPDRVILVHSQSSLPEAQRIAAEFKGSGIPFMYEQYDPVNVTQVLDKSRMMAKIMSDEDYYTINLTSGTKVWSILFREAFASKPNVKFIYVDQSCYIYDLSNGDSRQGAAINPDCVFRLNGIGAINYLNYSDLNDSDLNVLRAVKRLARVNWKEFNELTILSTPEKNQCLRARQGEIEHNESYMTWDRDSCTATVSISGRDGQEVTKTLTSPHVFNLLLNAGWFEAEVARILSGWRHSCEVRLNVKFPYIEGNPKNEIDVIVSTANRMMFVECKTQIHTLTDLDKFSKAVRNYGGTGCHALFVTYWTMTPEAAEKCRDNGIIPFSFKDTLDAWRDHNQSGFVNYDDVIARALYRLLDERLVAINMR